LKKVGKAIGRVVVAKQAYKLSGAQGVVGCVTHPSLAGCAKAALTVALTVGTDGLGGIAAHAAVDVAENAGAHAAEEAAATAADEVPSLVYRRLSHAE
jgi:hypothetical protein